MVSPCKQVFTMVMEIHYPCGRRMQAAPRRGNTGKAPLGSATGGIYPGGRFRKILPNLITRLINS